MANRTVRDAQSLHGTNPQYLVEKIIRARIYDCKYWKEWCFALTAELLVDRAMELRYIGGTFGGNIKVTPFLCLVLKMLQIQPDKDIIVEFIKQQDFKYVRCLGAIYLRLTCSSVDCYSYLEPLLVDYRKIRLMDVNGKYQLSHVDEFIDDLLVGDKVCSIILPRLAKRSALEETNALEPKISALEDDLDYEDDEDSSSDEEPSPRKRRSLSPEESKKSRRRSRSRDRRSRSRSKDRKSDDRKNKRGSSPDKRGSKRGGGKDDDGFKKDGLSVSETNKLRASLGLDPLQE